MTTANSSTANRSVTARAGTALSKGTSRRKSGTLKVVTGASQPLPLENAIAAASRHLTGGSEQEVSDKQSEGVDDTPQSSRTRSRQSPARPTAAVEASKPRGRKAAQGSGMKEVAGADASGKEVSPSKSGGRKSGAAQGGGVKEVAGEDSAGKASTAEKRGGRKAKATQTSDASTGSSPHTEELSGGITDKSEQGSGGMTGVAAGEGATTGGEHVGGGDQGNAAPETGSEMGAVVGDGLSEDDGSGNDEPANDDTGAELRLGQKRVLIEEMVVSGRGGRNVQSEVWPFAAMGLSTMRDDGEIVGPSFFIPEDEHPSQAIATGRKRMRGKPVAFITRLMTHTVKGQEDRGPQKGYRVWKVSDEVKNQIDEQTAGRK